ncbi:prepilin peptidase [Cellulomonas sp. NPDC055163]
MPQVRARASISALAALIALLGGAPLVRPHAPPELPAFLYLGAIEVALTVLDVHTRRLPNAITLVSYPVSAVLLTVASWVKGDWPAVLRATTAARVMILLYLVLAVVPAIVGDAAGMGPGDVKLAGLIDLYPRLARLGIAGCGRDRDLRTRRRALAHPARPRSRASLEDLLRPLDVRGRSGRRRRGHDPGAVPRVDARTARGPVGVDVDVDVTVGLPIPVPHPSAAGQISAHSRDDCPLDARRARPGPHIVVRVRPGRT